MRALMRDLVAPAPKLCIEIVDVGKRARRKEGLPQIVNLPFDLALLIRAVRRTGPRREMIVASELEQAWMEANRGARAFQYGAAQVIVDQGARDAMKRVKRF